MTSLEIILDRMKKQNITLDPEDKIVIPKDESYVIFNDTECVGRIFPEDGIIVTFLSCDDQYSYTGVSDRPFIWKIKNTYETWLSNGTISYRVQFYLVR